MTVVPRLFLSAAFLLASLLANGVFLVSPAAAQVDADLSKYCRTTFPGSAPMIRSPGGVSAHFCNQGGTPQGVDLARACELTTGSRNFTMLGTRVLCDDGPGPSDVSGNEPLGADDFVVYCRTRFPNSIYQDVPGDAGSRHHCRRPGGSGGFSLQPIDLADACDVFASGSTYREEGGSVFCDGAAGPPTAERRALGAGSSRGTESDGPGTDERADVPDPAGELGKSDDGTIKGSQDIATAPGGWKVRLGTLEGATILIVRDGSSVTGIVHDVPPPLQSYFRGFTSLEVGDTFMLGTASGTSFTGRTILGINGPRDFPAGTPCAQDILALRANRDAWPDMQATITDNQIVGTYRGINVWPNNGVCLQQPFSDFPPLVSGGRVKIEIEREGPCGVPKPVKLGKPQANPAKQDAADGKEEAAESSGRPSSIERYEAAKESGSPLEFYFWTDGAHGLSNYTTGDGDYGGPHKPQEGPTLDIDAVLELERSIRRSVEERRWEGAILIFDQFEMGTVRGVIIPADQLDKARPFLFLWDRASRALEQQDPDNVLQRPPIPEYEPEPAAPEAETAPDPDARPDSPLEHLNEAIVPC